MTPAMTQEQVQHIEERLKHYCTQFNSRGYRINNRVNEQIMTDIMYCMWQEMLALGLFSNFEEFPEQPLVVSLCGDVSLCTFIFREYPVGGRKWEIGL